MLRSSSPPYRVVSYYLDAGTWIYDDVDLDYLEAAARRTLEGVKRLVELAGGRDPRLSPDRGCFICPASTDCEPGRLVLQTPAERADAMP